MELECIYTLDAVKGFGPNKFKMLREAGVSCEHALADVGVLPFAKKTLEKLAAAITAISPADRAAARKRAEKQLLQAEKLRSWILSYAHPAYPSQLYQSNNAVPVLYVRGSLAVLSAAKTVAAVGSRKIRVPYSDLHRAFSIHAAQRGWAVVSGFALGADTIGHIAAHATGGQTICVMPSGLDRPFPPENRSLWEEFLNSDSVVFVSEFPFGTGAASLTLRKRNKLIVAFSRGVLISQTTEAGGAMNAYRFALEQGKPIATFAGDGSAETSGNAYMATVEGSRVTAFETNHRRGDQLETSSAFDQWLQELSSSI